MSKIIRRVTRSEQFALHEAQSWLHSGIFNPFYVDVIKAFQTKNSRNGSSWWAQQGSNLRPLPCEGNALPLSYAPDKGLFSYMILTLLRQAIFPTKKRG